ncbi:solute carrier family 25 member 40 isoform X2 [Vombatus ursinus]|uniref:solute carrier family 25 member 40 isoform X2 n=1 Tax=Vombatus ursinus TaxID=29139 RepID=UPI000FFD062F|nr:solute carrier family 25 member 40 isoform X2 [Vombatus ursinus]
MNLCLHILFFLFPVEYEFLEVSFCSLFCLCFPCTWYRALYVKDFNKFWLDWIGRLPSLGTARRCFLYCNGLMDHLYFCDEGSNKAWYKKAGRFRGTLDAFLKIIRNEGIKSLWSGLPPTLVMAVPATVIYFTCYDQLSLFMKSKVENEAFIPIFAGIVARCAVTVISPLELIRTKMQSKALSYKELHLFVRRKLSHDGWISLWRGWSSTVMRDVPFSAMYWYNFEVFKKWLCKNSDKHEPTFVINFAAGAVSGSIASIVTLPFDVVKTQKQTRLWRYEDVDLHNLPTSTWDIMKQIVSKHGISGLFAGLIPRLIKVAPACAIMVSTYEFGKAFFHQQNLKQEYHTSDCMDLK